MNYAITLTAFGLLIFLRKKGGGGGKGAPGVGKGAGGGRKWLQWVRGGLALIGGASLAETGVGVWLAARISDAAGLIAGLFGASSVLAVGAVTLIVTVIVCWDIGVDRVVDKPALIGLVMLPLLFLAAAGPLADAGSGLTSAVADVAASSLGRMIGG